MFDFHKIDFEYPLELSEKKDKNEHFILEGFAAANDFDLQNDIISDEALKKAAKKFVKKGKLCLNHTKEEIGKIIDCRFEKGKIWIKAEITKPNIIKKITSGELNSLSVKGVVDYEKIQRVFSPELNLIVKVVTDLDLEEVSLVPQGANPEAKAIQWYVSKSIGLAEKKMKKNLEEDFENLSEDEGEPEDVEEEIEETEETEEIKEENSKEDKEEEKEESSEEETEEEKTELSETYIEKSAYTSCMSKELKKGTPFKEAAKICSGKIKKSGKTIKMEKSAYTDCMKREMKAGKTMAEAAGICKKEAEGTNKKKYPSPKGTSSKYPYGYPYGYPYAYPYRYPKLKKDSSGGAIDIIKQNLDKLIKEVSDKKIKKELVNIRKMMDKLRRVGITAYPSPKNLSETQDEKLVYQVISPGKIEMSEGSRFKKELLREGTWFHRAAKDGVLKVTKDTLNSLVKNFKEKVLDNVFVPLGHPIGDDPSKNVGEVVDLEASDDGKLMAEIEVKDEGIAEKIKKGLIKGISASLVEDYVRKDTGENVGPVLFHAALVSEPYIKGTGNFTPVPLSEFTEDRLIVPIFNSEAPLTLEEISDKVRMMEKKLNLTDEISKEEKTSKENESTKEEETSEKETEEEKTESSQGGVKSTEGEEEIKSEETKTEETKSEAADVKKGVDLAEAEVMYEKLLRKGIVTPAEKELLIPLFTSREEIQLSEDKKVVSGRALYEYLKKQSPKFSLSESGTSEEPDKKEKDVEIPKEIDEQLEKMEFTDPEEKKAIYEEFKKSKGEKNSTPF